MLVTFTLATPFKDLKDVEGDRKTGVRTIPTVFGLEKGKKIVAALGFAAFAWIPFAMPAYASRIGIPALMGGLAFTWAVTRKDYDERKVFWVYYGFAAVSAIIISLG
ncbi:MAG: UbiA family prenyltransferase [Patescibacteria group bacterium]